MWNLTNIILPVVAPQVIQSTWNKISKSDGFWQKRFTVPRRREKLNHICHSNKAYQVAPKALKQKYDELSELLATHQWQDANDVYVDILFELCDQEPKSSLKKWFDSTAQEREVLIRTDIKILAQKKNDISLLMDLWDMASNSHFELKSQLQEYCKIKQRRPNLSDKDVQRELCKRIGWVKNSKPLDMCQLEFSLTAPKGHLPAFPIGTLFPPEKRLLPFLTPSKGLFLDLPLFVSFLESIDSKNI